MHLCLYPWRSEKDTRFPGTRVTNGCDLPYGYWYLNLGPLKEQPVYLSWSNFPSSCSWNLHQILPSKEPS